MGADVVIAVDIYCQGVRGDGLGALTVMHRVMHTQSCLVAQPEMAEADILIASAISVSSMSAKDDQERAIQAGYEAARTALWHQSSSARRSLAGSAEQTSAWPASWRAVGGAP
jgi:NTE family protein